MGTPTLTIEILSDSTRSKDMIDKLNTYMLSGVKEYWIIDTKQKSILVYNFANYEIDRFKVFEKGYVATSLVFQGLSMNVEDLFRDLI